MNQNSESPSVVCLIASARCQGNSVYMAEVFTGQAAQCGASVETFHLSRMSFKGCQGCLACKKGEDHCILRDDLTPILAKVSQCDVLVLATPIYFGDVTGQLKMFIDRCFSYYLPDYRQNPHPGRLTPGKTLVFLQTQGVDDPDAYENVFAKYRYFFDRFGFTTAHRLVAAGVREEGEAAALQGLQDDIRRLASDLTGCNQ